MLWSLTNALEDYGRPDLLLIHRSGDREALQPGLTIRMSYAPVTTPDDELVIFKTVTCRFSPGKTIVQEKIIGFLWQDHNYCELPGSFTQIEYDGTEVSESEVTTLCRKQSIRHDFGDV
jgi:hypothetical protein